jgi:hypothetical protein
VHYVWVKETGLLKKDCIRKAKFIEKPGFWFKLLYRNDEILGILRITRRLYNINGSGGVSKQGN